MVRSIWSKIVNKFKKKEATIQPKETSETTIKIEKDNFVEKLIDNVKEEVGELTKNISETGDKLMAIVAREGNEAVDAVKETVNKGDQLMSNVADKMKDTLIGMFLPILIGAAQKEIPVLIKRFLPPDKIEEMVKHLLDTIEEKIKESKTEWDDIALLPILQVLREAFSISDTQSIEGPVDITPAVAVIDKVTT